MKPNIGQGDNGKTQFFGASEKVWKDGPRIEACGSIDELNSVLGLTRSTAKNKKVWTVLKKLQEDLFVLGAQLSAAGKNNFPIEIGQENIDWLERQIKTFEKDVKPIEYFILPGGTQEAALLDVARTLCRKAERRVVTLHQKHPVPDYVLPYLNRLSDLLFTMERWLNKRKRKKEFFWIRTKRSKK